MLPGTATSCSDTGVPSGTYTYVVTAVWHSWSAASAASASVTVGNATQLAFTTAPVSGAASTTANLGPITVQVQDSGGNPVTVGTDTTVNQSSN